MKKQYIQYFFVIVTLLGSNKLMGQNEELLNDFNTYIGNYTKPFVTSFAWGMQNGWYNTARPHETLGFDLTIRGSLIRVPDTDALFEFIPSQYTTISASSNQLPTLVGPESSETLTYTVRDDNTGQTFSTEQNAPDGIQSSLVSSKYVPVPMIQLGIGVVKNTEIIVRYAPSVSIDQFSLRFFGVGVKHDWKQWISGLKDVPIDLSVLIAYTNLDTDLNINNDDFEGSNQVASFDTGAWTFQALVSKEISILTLYAGLGYNTSSSDVRLTGTYTLSEGAFSASIVDPVNQTQSDSGANATFGLRLKFAILTLHADYTFQEYNSITAGLGFSFR